MTAEAVSAMQSHAQRSTRLVEFAASRTQRSRALLASLCSARPWRLTPPSSGHPTGQLRCLCGRRSCRTLGPSCTVAAARLRTIAALRRERGLAPLAHATGLAASASAAELLARTRVPQRPALRRPHGVIHELSSIGQRCVHHAGADIASLTGGGGAFASELTVTFPRAVSADLQRRGLDISSRAGIEQLRWCCRRELELAVPRREPMLAAQVDALLVRLLATTRRFGVVRLAVGGSNYWAKDARR